MQSIIYRAICTIFRPNDFWNICMPRILYKRIFRN